MGASCERHLYYSDAVDMEDDWDNSAFNKCIQKGRDLGERMHNAMADVFTKSDGKVVLIGSDCPEISSAHIEDAFSALEDCDVVIGPAADGGYYLLGMRSLHHRLFLNKQWSTDSVLSSTLEDALELQLQVTLLPVLNDLDDEDDLQRSNL